MSFYMLNYLLVNRHFLGHPVGAHKGCQTLKIGKIELLNTMVHRDMQLAYELAFIREVRWVDVSKVWIGE